MSTSIRFVEARDLAALTEIYNHYVVKTPITFDLEPFSTEQRQPWLESFAEDGPHLCFVGEIDGEVRGWASTHNFRTKAAYASSVEVSVYLDPEAGGQGLGTRLYEELFESLKGRGLHRALAGITLPNPASRALHLRFGFEPVGVFHAVGTKFGRFWDVEWFEKDLSS